MDPFGDIHCFPIPRYLEDNIARIHSVTNGGTYLNNEAFSRTILDQILICSLYEEGQRLHQQPKHAKDEDSSHAPPQKSHTSTEEEPAKLGLLHEMPLSKVVSYKGETKLLSGYADYSVWYDSAAKNTLATNLLIVEAKRQYYTDVALPQLAGYMGIVHTARKEKFKQNCVVYGVVSDGRTFRFCRIDNNGAFAQSNLLDWERHNDQIYSIVRSLLRAAALSSPSTTPIKDPMRRKIVLASCGSPERTRRFDYGFGQLHVYYEDEVEDAEIVHLNRDSQQ